MPSRHGLSNPAQRELYLTRGLAIAEYAELEGSIAHLFAHLIGADIGVASVPFFKMNNARSRLNTLDDLLKLKHQNEFNLFWNSLYKLLEGLDAKRNHIVHWSTKQTLDGTPDGTFTLIPPNYWISNENTPSIAIEEIQTFIDKCDFLADIVFRFALHLSGKDPAVLDRVPQPWPEIFRQPIAYPPPVGHPLHRTPTTPAHPPPP